MLQYASAISIHSTKQATNKKREATNRSPDDT
jgi:hypothetical protein